MTTINSNNSSSNENDGGELSIERSSSAGSSQNRKKKRGLKVLLAKLVNVFDLGCKRDSISLPGTKLQAQDQSVADTSVLTNAEDSSTIPDSSVVVSSSRRQLVLPNIRKLVSGRASPPKKRQRQVSRQAHPLQNDEAATTSISDASGETNALNRNKEWIRKSHLLPQEEEDPANEEIFYEHDDISYLEGFSCPLPPSTGPSLMTQWDDYDMHVQFTASGSLEEILTFPAENSSSKEVERRIATMKTTITFFLKALLTALLILMVLNVIRNNSMKSLKSFQAVGTTPLKGIRRIIALILDSRIWQFLTGRGRPKCPGNHCAIIKTQLLSSDTFKNQNRKYLLFSELPQYQHWYNTMEGKHY